MKPDYKVWLLAQYAACSASARTTSLLTLLLLLLLLKSFVALYNDFSFVAP